MTRQIVSLASAALFALSVSAAWAQPPSQDGGPAGPGGGGTAVGGGCGGAVSNPSAGSSGGGSAVSSSGGGGSSSGSLGGWGSGGFGESPRSLGAPSGRISAPMRDPSVAYSPAMSGEGGGQQRTAPRGGGENGGRTGERAVPRGEGGGRVAGRSEGSTVEGRGGPERQRGPVPTYSRPREGRTAVGSAVERTEATRGGGGGGFGSYYDPYFWYGYGGFGYYSRYNRYGYPGYGFGLGYYDPFMFGGFYGYDPYYSGYYGGGGSGYYRSSRYDTGSLRLKVKPADAKVYIDGYFVGIVDGFDGVFQRLAVEAGAHRVEIRADGYEPAQFEVLITAGETVTYKGELKRTIQ